MFSLVKERMDMRKHDGELDSGDVVQTVILIAGFVIITILVVLWIGNAIKDKGADAAACINDSNSFTKAGGVDPTTEDGDGACVSGAGTAND